MAVRISPLEKELAEHPIDVPENPFWEVFKRFGRDESIAMGMNVGGTAAIPLLIADPSATMLAVAGPIVEKAGFFPAHFKEAYDVWKTTPEKDREKISKYLADAFKGGSVSLLEDILVHDPVYVGLMFAGMALYPSTPAWLLATASFIAAVGIVAVGEVGVTEARYKLLQRKLKKLGFGKEKYFESRFFIDAEKIPEHVLDDISEEFGLGERHKGEYHDRYFPTKLKRYSGRKPKFRLRQRFIEAEGRYMQSAQVVYTKVSELSERDPNQFRFFPCKKDKLYFDLNSQDMPASIDEIEDDGVRSYLQKITDDEKLKSKGSRTVQFERKIARNPEGLFASVDHVVDDKYFALELKVYKDLNLLKQAMRYIMREFPVLQITHGKADIAVMNGK